jgi:hypothetical protein
MIENIEALPQRKNKNIRLINAYFFDEMKALL